ncbi:MAG: SsrA-binding protein SmpB [Parcubacteria group bacterium]
MPAFATNRKASFNYDIREMLEAGIELLGWEVKSVKNGRADLSGSYGIIRNGEVWLVNLDIPLYQPKNTPGEPDISRAKRILLNKKEITEILKRTESERLSIIPLELYGKHGRVKVKLGLGSPRRKADKREVIKKRDISKELGRKIK